MRARLLAIVRAASNVVRHLAVVAVCLGGTYFLADKMGKHYPVDQWLVWKLLPIWGYTLLFNAGCLVGGAATLGLVIRERRLPVLEWLIYSMAFGVVELVIGLYLLGYGCALTSAGALAVPIAMLVIGAPGSAPLWRAIRRWRRRAPKLSNRARAAAVLAAGFGAAMIALLYVEALSVKSINFDAKWYHYPIAQDYARTACVRPQLGDSHRSFPHLTSVLHTWALLAKGVQPLVARWMLSLHLEFSMVIWRVVGVAAGISWMLKRERSHGLWAVFFLYPQLFVYDQHIGGSADHVLGFFATPIMLAAARTLKRFEWRWGVVLGVALGGHMLTKYQAVYLFGAVTAMGLARWGYLLVRRIPRLRRDGDPTARSLAIGLGAVMLVTAVVSAPHYVKNAIVHKNPVYPIARSVFKSSTPRARPSLYKATPKRGWKLPGMKDHSGVAKQGVVLAHLLDFWTTTRNRSLTKKRPYMGALFSLLLPCAFLVARTRRIWFAIGLTAIGFVLWANTAPNDRYLIAFLDLGIAASAALAVRVWQMGKLGKLALIPLVAVQSFIAVDTISFWGNKRLSPARALSTGGHSGRDIEARLVSPSEQTKITKATPHDAVIIARNYKALLGLDRTVISDSHWAGGTISYSGVKNPGEIWDQMHAVGATHMLYPHGKRPPERLNNVVLFAELFHHHATRPRKVGTVRLAEFPKKRPEGPDEYLVMLYRARGYPSGLYAVQQLDIEGRHAKRFKPKPKPRMRAGKKNLLQILEKAHAAVTCSKLPSNGQTVLNREFKSFERLRKCSIYLRKPSTKP